MEMKLFMFGSNRKESRIIESQNPVDCCAVEMELNPINKVINSIFMVLFFDKSKGFTVHICILFLQYHVQLSLLLN